jgi:hypothetical protein
VAVLCILWHKHSRTGSVKVWEFAFYTGRAYANGIICVCVENIKKKKATSVRHGNSTRRGGSACCWWWRGLFTTRESDGEKLSLASIYIYIHIYVCMCEGKPIYSSTDVVHLLLYCIYAYVYIYIYIYIIIYVKLLHI